MRSGYIHINIGRMGNLGTSGYDWASFAQSYGSSVSATARYLGVHVSGINPFGGPDNRWNGFPLR